MKRAEQLRPPRPQGVDPRAPHTRASRSRAGLDFVGKFLFFLLARELHSLCVFPPFDKDRNPANKIPSSLSPGPAPRRRSRGKGSPRGSRCHRLARDRAVPLGDPGHQDEERGAGEGAGNRNWRRRREQPTARARWCRRHVVQSAERSLQVLPGPGGGPNQKPGHLGPGSVPAEGGPGSVSTEVTVMQQALRAPGPQASLCTARPLGGGPRASG